MIRVRDTGEGIPTDMLHSIFDLFVQAGGTLDRSDGGMGVGLTLVQKLVELHGGTVAAYSDGLGTGSEFVVRLPVCTRPQPPNGSSMANPDLFASAGSWLSKTTPTAERCSSPCWNWTATRSRPPRTVARRSRSCRRTLFDIALVDIGLPGMDGYQVAETIRKDPRHSGIRLVALTGYGRTADREAVQAAGFDEHLVKPLDHRKLTSVLTKYGPGNERTRVKFVGGSRSSHPHGSCDVCADVIAL